jgi:hypothetical protein
VETLITLCRSTWQYLGQMAVLALPIAVIFYLLTPMRQCRLRKLGLQSSTAREICLLLFVATVLHKLYRLGLDACGTGSFNCRPAILLSLFPAGLSLISWLLLMAAKVGSYPAGLSIYRFANYHLYGFQRLILGAGNDPAAISWLHIILAIFPAVVTVICGTLSYAIGAKGLHPVKWLLRKLKYKGA